MKEDELSKNLLTKYGRIVFFTTDEEEGRTAAIYDCTKASYCMIPIKNLVKSDIIYEPEVKKK